MALRLRRGTDAERLLITPLEGELIYTTDTKQLFVGDGITVGGNVVDTGGGAVDLSQSSLNDLADVNADSTVPADGAVLQYDVTSGDWRSKALEVADITDVTAGSPNDGDVLSYNVSTGKWENTAVAGVVNTLAGLIDVTIDFGDSTGPVDGEALIWEADQSRWRPGPLNTDNITDIDKVLPTEGQVLSYDAAGDRFINRSTISVDVVNNLVDTVNANIVTLNATTVNGEYANFTNIDAISFVGDIVGPDSTVILDSGSGVLTGSLNGDSFGIHTGTAIGNFRGDAEGRFFANDSSVLVDGFDSTVRGFFKGELETENVINRMYATSENAVQKLYKHGGTLTAPTEPSNFARVGIAFGSYNTSAADFIDETILFSYHQTAGGGYVALSPVSQDNTTFFETAVELDGNAQTMTVAAPGGTTFNGTIKPGVYADSTARDAAITSPVAGMMIFVTDIAKFQGYDGTTWANLN